MYGLILSMNKTKKFIIYRGRVEVYDSIFGWICFFFHSLSIVDKEYESLETEIKIWVNVIQAHSHKLHKLKQWWKYDSYRPAFVRHKFSSITLATWPGL